jgi:hypothetical protein
LSSLVAEVNVTAGAGRGSDIIEQLVVKRVITAENIAVLL